MPFDLSHAELSGRATAIASARHMWLAWFLDVLRKDYLRPTLSHVGACVNAAVCAAEDEPCLLTTVHVAGHARPEVPARHPARARITAVGMHGVWNCGDLRMIRSANGHETVVVDGRDGLDARQVVLF